MLLRCPCSAQMGSVRWSPRFSTPAHGTQQDVASGYHSLEISALLF